MLNATMFLINVIFSLYIFVLMLRVMLEWVSADYYHPVSQLVFRLTDAPVKPFSRIIPQIKGVDAPAIVLMIIVELIKLSLFCFLASSGPNILGLVFWAVIDLAKELINLYFYMIILFVILSWLGNARTNDLAVVLFRLVDPLLRHARRLVPLIANIDFSPLIVILVLQLVNIFILVPLFNVAMSMTFGG
tara:strand:- start:155 stop:724 length:570 start_codon:yes stop_codon:yes gene_type:complete